MLFPLHMTVISKNSSCNEQPNLLSNGPLWVEKRTARLLFTLNQIIVSSKLAN